MTVETVLILDSITCVGDLQWNNYSYDTGHPKCICSACLERIKDPDEFEDPESDECQNHFPVRLWSGKGKDMLEAVLHLECFQYLHSRIFITK